MNETQDAGLKARHYETYGPLQKAGPYNVVAADCNLSTVGCLADHCNFFLKRDFLPLSNEGMFLKLVVIAIRKILSIVTPAAFLAHQRRACHQQAQNV